jgi:hypothetical protein
MFSIQGCRFFYIRIRIQDLAPDADLEIQNVTFKKISIHL